MKKAIKVLEKRIEALNREIENHEKTAEEPEMISDYEFSMNAIGNAQTEILEMVEAINILNQKT